MPQTNIVKEYVAEMHYHVYNRGTRKDKIFWEESDYWVFRRIVRRKLRRLQGRIKLDTYSLLPNHYHFLLFQTKERDMEHFMRSVMTSYGMFVNRKQRFTGHVFSGSYQAVMKRTEKDVEKTRRYIYDNPIQAGLIGWKHFGSGEQL